MDNICFRCHAALDGLTLDSFSLGPAVADLIARELIDLSPHAAEVETGGLRLVRSVILVDATKGDVSREVNEIDLELLVRPAATVVDLTGKTWRHYFSIHDPQSIDAVAHRIKKFNDIFLTSNSKNSSHKLKIELMDVNLLVHLCICAQDIEFSNSLVSWLFNEKESSADISALLNMIQIFLGAE